MYFHEYKKTKKTTTKKNSTGDSTNFIWNAFFIFNFMFQDTFKLRDANIFVVVEKENHMYLVGPYYAGPKSTPAHFTPALIPPRANFDLPPFRAAFNATIGKNQKNQKKGKVFNLQ